MGASCCAAIPHGHSAGTDAGRELAITQKAVTAVRGEPVMGTQRPAANSLQPLIINRNPGSGGQNRGEDSGDDEYDVEDHRRTGNGTQTGVGSGGGMGNSGSGASSFPHLVAIQHLRSQQEAEARAATPKQRGGTATKKMALFGAVVGSPGGGTSSRDPNADTFSTGSALLPHIPHPPSATSSLSDVAQLQMSGCSSADHRERKQSSKRRKSSEDLSTPKSSKEKKEKKDKKERHHHHHHHHKEGRDKPRDGTISHDIEGPAMASLSGVESITSDTTSMGAFMASSSSAPQLHGKLEMVDGAVELVPAQFALH